MRYRGLIGASVVLAILEVGGAQSQDAKYPDWKGQWLRGRGVTNQAT